MSHVAGCVGWTVVAAAAIVAAGCGAETYFFPYPAIDTKFAPGFDEARFDLVQIGMSKEEVVRLIGDPLDTDQVAIAYSALPEGAVEQWSYSADGACSWADFPWLARSVYFDRYGRVTEVAKRVYYD